MKNSETAYADYYGDYFSQYNPDDLIGRKGYKIYKRMMLDEQVKAVVRFKRDTISGRDWFVKFDAEDKEQLGDEEANSREKILTKLLEAKTGTFRDGLNDSLTAMQTGFSLLEKSYKQVEVDGRVYWGLKSLNRKPFDTFIFKRDEYGQLVELQQVVNGKTQTLNYDDFIHFVVNPDIDPFYGQSELREAYRSYFSKDVIIRLQNIFLERHATGKWSIQPQTTDIKKGSTDYNQIVNLLNNIQAKTGVLLPKDWKLEELTKGSHNPAFGEAIAQNDKSIAKAILVPNLLGLSEQGSVGSYSQSQTQFEVFMLTITNDSERLLDIYNQSLIRPLIDINFGDGIYPKLCFEAVHTEQETALLDKFIELTSKGVIKPTEDDETFLRNKFGLPSRKKDDDDDGDGGATKRDPTSALNGIQITALTSVVEKVKTGTLDPEAAKHIILISFPISEDQVDALIESIDVDVSGGDDVSGDDNGDRNDDDPGVRDPNDTENTGPNNGDAGGGGTGDPAEEDRARVARNGSLITTAQFSKALTRVDFKVIEHDADRLVLEGTDALSTASVNFVKAITNMLETKQINADTPIEEVNAINTPKGAVKMFKDAANDFLTGAVSVGTKQAHKELERAKVKHTFAATTGLTTEALSELLENNKTDIANRVTARLTAQAKEEIVNGIKYQRTNDQIVKSILKRYAREGLITVDDAEDILGEPLDLDDLPALSAKATNNLRSVVNTSIFDVMNEARYSIFTDSDLDDFVQGLEYSAIIDSRTTPICRHLDGKQYAKNSEHWTTQGLRPPNHFNCRSLLVAVTTFDTFTESEAPDPTVATPAAGFN